MFKVRKPPVNEYNAVNKINNEKWMGYWTGWEDKVICLGFIKCFNKITLLWH